MRAKGELDGGGVVATRMSNLGLERSLAAYGINVAYAEVGDRFVYEKMLETGYLLGGESSGHIIFRKYATTGDGVLTALKIMELMMQSKCPLSVLVEGYRPLPQVKRAVRVRDKEVISTDRVLEAKAQAEEALKGGRVLLRASGTEPVIRILTEGEDGAACAQAADLLERAVRAAEDF